MNHGWFRHKSMVQFWSVGCKRRLLEEDMCGEISFVSFVLYEDTVLEPP